SIDVTHSSSGRQPLQPHVFPISRVVSLVELVATAEFASDRVPDELHELDALGCLTTAGSSDVPVDERQQIGALQVLDVRARVNQARAQRLFEELLDPTVGRTVSPTHGTAS